MGRMAQGEREMPSRYPQLRHLMAAAVVVNLGGGHAVADETPKEIVAAKIRMQGFACHKPVSAERDSAASKPNEAVWLLRCQDYSYRVRLVPNMAADVAQSCPFCQPLP
jgi:hypothetical protein